MTAITKSWTSIADSAIDPDSPITTGLMTALRDNDVYLREWLGASYTAGAVQDHTHDGSNSALIEVGPNLVRNGSFESGSSGWTLTTYSGGTAAVGTSGATHGVKALAITSTVTANGGGYAVGNEYLAVGSGDVLLWMAFVSASVANVSSAIYIRWYDSALSQVSASTLYNPSNTPTTATLQSGYVSVPGGGVRYARIVVAGGVPGVGSAAGTIYFDGVRLNDWAGRQELVLAGSIGQAQLKSASGTVSTLSSSYVVLTLPGGAYGFFPQIYNAGSDAGSTARAWGAETSTNSDTGLALIALKCVTSFSDPAVAEQRYIQSSPPYDLGDGDVPLFAFAAMDSCGGTLATYVAPDPPWANNGPTDIAPHYYRGGLGYRRGRALDAAAVRARGLGAVTDAEWVEIAVDAAFKNRDMARIPHPFRDGLEGATPVLLDPVSDLTHAIAALHAEGESVSALLHRYLVIDNEPLARAAPPGVLPVRARWKETRR